MNIETKCCECCNQLFATDKPDRQTLCINCAAYIKDMCIACIMDEE